MNRLLRPVSIFKRPSSQVQRLQALLQQATSFAVSHPNSTELWTMTRLAMDQALYAEWSAGRLLGDRASDAYFVRCDASTMTQADIANARLVAVAGVALIKPAEFETLTVVHRTSA